MIASVRAERLQLTEGHTVR